MVFFVRRKIFRSGNSLLVSLPLETLVLLGLGEGSEVTLRIEPGRQRIVIEPADRVDPGISPEFGRQLDEFIEQYRPALESLAGQRRT